MRNLQFYGRMNQTQVPTLRYFVTILAEWGFRKTTGSLIMYSEYDILLFINLKSIIHLIGIMNTT